MRHALARTSKASQAPDPEGSDLAQLAEGVFRRYGYDLRYFDGAYLRRRLEAAMRYEEVKTLPPFRERLLTSPDLMERLLLSLSGGPRAMFKDPEFHLYLRREVLPVLRTYPFLRIWIPGCSNGPEVFGLAVMLAEEGLYDRCRLYATDLSQEAVRKAREGSYPITAVRKWAASHLEAGGKVPLSEYFHAESGKANLLPELRRNMVFAQHNLAVDGSFNEFNLILCRNVLSTLDPSVRRKVHGLLHESLTNFGYLALGVRESLGGEDLAGRYREVDSRYPIYRKVS